ncbi:Ig-like domain-containing protein [Marinomonas sp. IMCC 4694]|nr:Ig-like domain-containing protein [Marinomonas sp. IMCC 4694]
MGSHVRVTIAGGQYVTDVDSSGVWSVALTSSLSQGEQTFSAIATDAAGNSTVPVIGSFTVDTETSVTGGLSSASDSGRENDDDITNATKPIFNGTAEIGATVSLAIGGNTYAAIVDESGNWTATVTDALSNGTKPYTVSSTDLAGNTATATGSIEIDNVAPTQDFTIRLASGSDTGSSLTDKITYDKTPTFEGTAEAGSTVTLKVDNTVRAVDVSDAGTWSVTYPELADGVKAVAVYVTDVAGNIANMTDFAFTVDTTTTVAGAMSADSDKGFLNTDEITHVTTPTFNGTGEAGATLVLTINSEDYETTIGTDGNWSVQVTEVLPEGNHDYTITATDVAGNVASDSGTATIDLTDPDNFTGGLDADSDTGTLDNDALTNDTTPTFTGTGEVGSKVTLTLDNQNTTVTVDGDGKWSITPDTALTTAGNYPYALTAQDVAGNTKQITDTFTLDLVATLSGRLDADSDNGFSDSDNLTNVTTPTFTGAAEAGTVVSVLINEKTYSTTVAAGQTTWSITVPESDALTDTSGDTESGTDYDYTISAVDYAGNTATPVTGKLTLDTSNPTPLTGGLKADADNDTGRESDDTITNNRLPTFEGTVEEGAKVTLKINGGEYQATVTGTTWTYTLQTGETLPANGTLNYTIEAEDKAGNISTLSRAITVDTTNPEVTSALAVESDSGVSNSDDLTNDTTPTLKGTSDANADIVVTISSTGSTDKVYTTQADSDGNWSITVPAGEALSEGEQNYTVKATDVAGNTTTLNGDTFTVDTTAPTTLTTDLATASDSRDPRNTTGTNSDGITNDTTPTLTGTVEAGSTVQITINNNTFDAVVIGTTWSYTPTADLPQGTYNYRVVATDVAGNSTAAETDSFTIDTQIASFTGRLQAASDTGDSNADDLTKTTQPTFAGNVEAGSVVILSINGQSYNATVDASGNWTAQVGDALTDATHAYSLTAVDVAGNEQVLSGSITVDTQAPTEDFSIGLLSSSDTGSSNTDKITNDKTPTLTGTAEAGATVALSIDNVVRTVQVSDTGTWSVTYPELADGKNTVTVSVTDVAGNEAAMPDYVFTLDTATTVTARLDADSDKGNLSTDSITNIATPIFSGSGEVGASIALLINGKTHTSTVGSEGTWSIAVPAVDALDSDSYDYKVTATDVAGNEATAEGTVLVDLLSPTISFDQIAADGVLNIVESGKSLTITGTTTDVENNQILSLSLNDKSYTATVIGNVFSIVVPADDVAALTAEDYTVTASVSDVAGNSATKNASFTTDLSAPVVTINIVATDDYINLSESGQAVIVSGTASGAESGRTVEVTLGSNTYETTVDENQNWSLSLTLEQVALLQNNATTVVYAQTTDEAGNVSNQASRDIYKDITPPTLIINDIAEDNVVNLQESQSVVTISGTVSGVADGRDVSVELNGKTYTAEISNGNWLAEINSTDVGALADAKPHSVVVSVSDVAGNITTQSKTLSVDKTIPEVSINTLSGDGYLNAIEAGQALVISGSTVGVENGQSVTVLLNYVSYSTTVTNNTWTIPASALADANLVDGQTYPVTANVKDIAGNAAVEATANLITDYTKPNLTIDLLSNNDYINAAESSTALLVSGTSDAENGQTVTLTLGDYTTTTTVQNGVWSKSIPDSVISGLNDGDYFVVANVTDVAGNEADTATRNVTVDTSVPVITVSTIAQDGLLNTVERDAGLTITGTTDDVADGQKVLVTLNSKTYEAIIADNAWSVSVVASDLNDLTDNTTYPVSLSVSDLAGNTGNKSETLRTDFTPPTIEINDLGDNVLNIAERGEALEITGTTGDAEVGQQVTVTFNNQPYYGSVASDGTWSVTVPSTRLSALNDATPYTIEANVSDASGNPAPSATLAITTDFTVPVVSFNAISEDTSHDYDETTETDFYTSDQSLTLLGTTEAGATVRVYDSENQLLGLATVQANGAWSYAHTNTLAEGSHVFNVIATDAAGNSRDVAQRTITIDTSAPTVSIVGISPDSGAITDDGITNSQTLKFNGTAEANAWVVVSVNDSVIGQVKADTGGVWTFDYTGTTLAEGEYTLKATSVDQAGNTSSAAEFAFEVDTTNPIGSFVSMSTDSNITNDWISSDTTPTFNGTAEQGSKVQLYVDGTLVKTIAAMPESASWSISFDEYKALIGGVDALSEGSHSLTMTLTDVAGNTASYSKGFTIDSEAPDVAIASISDDTNVAGDFYTSDGTLTFTGTAEAGASVRLNVDGELIATVTANSQGVWSYEYTTDLGSDTYTLTATASDVAGNSQTATQNFIVDKVNPNALSASLASDSGISAEDFITQNGELTISGLETNATWQYSTDGGTNWLAGSGDSFTLASNTTYVQGTVRVRQFDLAGNESAAWSNASAIVIDNEVATPSLRLSEDTGAQNSDWVTQNRQLNVDDLETGSSWEYSLDNGSTWTTGTGTTFTLADNKIYSNEQVQVRQTDVAGNVSLSVKAPAITIDNTKPAVVTVTLDADTGQSATDWTSNNGKLNVSGVEANGSWFYRTSADGVWTEVTASSSFTLTEGVYEAGSVQVKQRDLAGNDSDVWTNEQSIIIDQTPYAAPTVVLENDEGTLDDDWVTNDGTFVVGNIETNATWEYSTNNGASWTQGVGTSFDVAEGNYSIGVIQVRQSDVSGNVSTKWTSTKALEVDTTIPAAPTVGLVKDTGSSSTDWYTNDGEVRVSNLEVGATWKYSLDGGTTWNAGDSDTNIFSLTDNTTYDAGDIQVRQYDLAGNEGTVKSLGQVVVDVTAPVTPAVVLASDTGSDATDWITGNGQLNVTLEEGAIWYYSLDRGVNYTPGTGTSFTLEEGSYASGEVRVYQVDKAGNESTRWESPIIQVITTPPTVDSVALVSGEDTGLSTTDFITNKQSLTFEGTTSGNVEFVTINFNGSGDVNVAVSEGEWRYGPTENLVADEYTFEVFATDIAGNTSGTVTQAVVIDTTEPAAPTDIVLTTDSGTEGDNKTNDTTPSFQGNAEPFSEVTMTFDLGNGVTQSATAIANASGVWSLTVSEAFSDGSFSYTASTKDLAGNVSSTVASGSLTVDTTPPVVSNVELYNSNSLKLDEWLTNDATGNFKLTGTAEPNAIIYFYKNGSVLGNATTDTVGDFEYVFNINTFVEGTFAIKVQAKDDADNLSTAFTKQLVVDRSIELTGGLEKESDSGVSDVDGNTSNPTPTFSGTTDPEATVTIQIGNVSQEVIADIAGVWSYTPFNDISDGNYGWSISAVDTAGNSTSALGTNLSGLLVIDTEAPMLSNVAVQADFVDGTDDTTNDRVLNIVGESEPDAYITLKIDSQDFFGRADGNGDFTITTSTLSYADHTFRVIAADAAGNETEVVDTVVIQPNFIPLEFNLADDSNSGSSFDFLTNENNPTIIGRGTPGSTVTLTITNSLNADIQVYTTTPSSAGNWQIAVDIDLPDDAYTFSARSVKVGVDSDDDAHTVIIDTQNTLTFGLSASTDSSGGEAITNASSVEITGTSDPSANVSVVIFDGRNEQVSALSATTKSDGTYLLAVPGLSEGDYTYVVTSIDKADNRVGGDASYTGAFTINRVPPTITGGLHPDDDSGMSDSDGITSDNTPRFAGTIEGEFTQLYVELNGQKIYVYREDANGVAATNLVDENGNWELPITTPLADGYHNYIIVATDAANNEAKIQDSIRVKTNIEFTTYLENDSGESDTDFISNETHLVLKGITEPGNTIEAILYNTSNEVLNTLNLTSNNSGYYTADFGENFDPATYKVVFNVSDAAGNNHSLTIEEVVVDTAVADLTMSFDSTSDTGTVEVWGAGVIIDGITNVSNPVFSGEGEPKSIITITLKDANDNVVKETTAYVGLSGNWNYSPGVLDDGAYTISAVASDVAGNLSLIPAELSFTVKTTDPNLTWQMDYDTNNDGIINEAEYAASDNPGEVRFSGTGDAGDKITLTISGQEYRTDVANDGTWLIDTPKLSDLLYNFQLQAEDVAGNVTTVNNSVILDSGISASIWMKESDDTLYKLDEITSNTNPGFGILTEKDNEITVVVRSGSANGTVFYQEAFTATANSFNWQLPNGQTYPDGDYYVQVSATDIASNEAISGNLKFVIDTQVDVQSAVQINYSNENSYRGALDDDGDDIYYTNISQFSIRSHVENEIYNMRITPVDSSLSGNWTRYTSDKLSDVFTIRLPEALSDGQHQLTISWVDRAGNEDSQVITVDINNGIDTFNWSVSDFTRDGDFFYGSSDSATFSGQTDAGATVRVTLNGVNYSTTADANGDWSVTATGLTDGVFQASVSASDQWGNSRYSVNQVFVVDTFAPTFNYNGGAEDQDSTEDILWNSEARVLSGRAEPNTFLTISIDGDTAQDITLDASGYWSFNLSSLGDGSHDITLLNEDLSGNPSSKNFTVVVDTSTPTATIELVSDALKGGDTTLVTVIFSEAVSSFALEDITANNGVLSNLIKVSDTEYTATLAINMGVDQGTNSISLATTYEDWVGNQGTLAASANYTIDSTAPTAAITVSDTVLSMGESTQVNILFSENVSDFELEDLIADNGVLSHLVRLSETEYTVTLTPSINTEAGGNSVRLSANYVDAVGNIGTVSTSGSYLVDTQAPTITSITLSDTELKIGDTATVTLQFSEAVNDLELSDLIIGHGVLSALAQDSQDSSVWTAILTPSADVEDTANVITLANGFTDINANVGVGGSSNNYSVDTSAPTVSENGLTEDTDSGLSPSDSITNSNQPTFEGTGSVGDSVTVTVFGSSAIATTTVDANGEWTATLDSALNDGVYQYTVTAEDVAGNKTTLASNDLTIDTQAPVSSGSAEPLVGDTSISGNVSGEDGAIIAVTLNGAAYGGDGGMTSVQSGMWSISGAALSHGDTVIATISDIAGNEDTTADIYAI